MLMMRPAKSQSQMCMVSKFLAAALLALAITSQAPAASDPDTNSVGGGSTFDFPRDSPVLLVSFIMGSSPAKIRGASMLIDLHASAVLRNVGTKSLSGLTMRVEAPDLPSGKGKRHGSQLEALNRARRFPFASTWKFSGLSPPAALLLSL